MLTPDPAPRASSAAVEANVPACISFGLTGHRPDRLGRENLANVRLMLDRLLAAIEAQFSHHPPCAFRLVTALAEGADAIGAEVAIARGWQLDLILPFFRDEYAEDFAAGVPRDEFERDLAQARSVLELDGRAGVRDRDLAYERAGRVMLAQSDVLIAVWDGGPSRGRGGAPQVIAEAVLEGVAVIHLHPDDRHPAQLLWDGLTEIDLGQQSLETVARGSIDALPALLATIVAPAGVETQAIAQFERRAERRWTVMLAYPLLLALVGVRGLRRTDFGQATAGDALPVPNAGGPAFAARIAQLLTPRFAHANAVASQYAQAFRSGYVANFALAAAAVVLSLLGLALSAGFKPLLLALELGAIGTILLQTRTGNRAQWHGIWLDSRAISERLRCLAVSAQLGDLELRMSHSRAPPWVGHYVNATARAVGLPIGRIDTTYLGLVKTALLAMIDDQFAYLSGEARRMHKLEHRLHIAGTVLFATTALTCAGFLALKIEAAHAVAPYTALATIVGAALPAIGAAIYGIRMQGDFAGIAERDAALAAELATIRGVIVTDPLGFDTLSRRVRRVSSLLTEDLGSWLQTYRARPLALPG